jgi:orotate phosphoribosyltransferase
VSPKADIGINDAMALYELTVSDGEFVVVNANTGLPFELSHYSEFKYGRRDIAERYGSAMAELLIAHFADESCEPIVVIGTPYKRVPNAARMLAISAERHMRTAGLPTSYSYIYQHRLAAGDYSALPQRVRDQRNKQKKRYVDPDDFAGKRVVVIDDIRITGSIEHSIMTLLDDIAVLSTTIVNLVRLDPDVALREPHLEERLNHSAVAGLPDLLRLMRDSDQFVLTTRAVKFILQSESSDLSRFLGWLNPAQILELYEAIVDEGYDQMPLYTQAFRLVCDALLVPDFSLRS